MMKLSDRMRSRAYGEYLEPTISEWANQVDDLLDRITEIEAERDELRAEVGMKISDEEMKSLFREKFTTNYIQHMKDTCECGGRDIEEVLFMAFCHGYTAKKVK